MDIPDDVDPILDLGFETSRRAPWLEGLRQHLDVYNYLGTRQGMTGIAGMMYTILSTQYRSREAAEALRLDEGARRVAAETFREILGKMETVYVAPNFVSLAEAGMQGMENYEFRISDIMVPEAFYYLARPAELLFNEIEYDDEGKLIEESLNPSIYIVRAITTHRLEKHKDYLRITMWGHADDHDRQDPDEIESLAGHEWDQYRWIPLYTHQVDNTTTLDSEVNPGVIFLLALNLFMQQKIGYMRGVKPPRDLRRQAERTSPNFGDIIVAHVRRRVPRNPGEPVGGDERDSSGIEYSHRWIVRGFWRNQWYPSEQRHKPLWIAPYPKGPADKPLIIKDRIMAADQ